MYISMLCAMLDIPTTLGQWAIGKFGTYHRDNQIAKEKKMTNKDL